MSENISPTSQTGQSNSFEAPEAVEGFAYALTSGYRPDPALTVSEWADEYRVLSSRGSAEPGKFRTSRTPYMREIMDCLSSAHPAQRIVFMAGAQLGKTEAGNNWLGYCIHQVPGPFIAVQPTVELAQRLSQQRIDPLIDETPELKERILPARSRDSGNTIKSKKFPGGQLVITGANSAVGLRSMPARYLFLDEIDGYPLDVDGEGDPISLAAARSRTFGHRRKILMTSTPTVKGFSRIEKEYEASDKRRYFVPCPHCGEAQWLKFERLRWEKGRPEIAAYHCENCEEPILEHHKTWMLQNGEWRATSESSDPHLIGFHISGLYSPVGWLAWGQIAREWEAAQGNDAALKTAKNTLLGETWQEQGEAPDWERLSDRREKFVAPVPDGTLFLTAGVDVQGNRLEADIWAWGRGLESWLVDHVVIEGGPATPEAWEGLDELLSQTWTHQSGLEMKLSRLCIDTGYETSAVYAWARRAGFGHVSPIKGVEGFNRSSPVSGPTFVDATIKGKKLSRGARLWTIAVSTFKSETYRFLNLSRPSDEDRAEGVVDPAGTIHLPQWADSEWIRQLVAEQLTIVKTRRGFQKLEWQKMRERNEALDCRVYARAAAWILGADRWSDKTWRELEAQFPGRKPTSREIEEHGDEPPAPEPKRASVPVRKRGRSVRRSSWMG